MPVAILGWFGRLREGASRQRIERMLPRLLRAVYRAMGLTRDLEATAKATTDLGAANPGWSPADTRRRASMTMLLFAMPAVYGIDLCMFAPMTAHYAAAAVGRNEVLLVVARLLVPLAILLLELGVATHLHLAREERKRGGGWGPVLGWTGIGLLTTGIVSGGILAASLARQTTRDAMNALESTIENGAWATAPVSAKWMGLAPDLAAQTATIVSLALVAHVIVLFGGRQALEAKAYAAYRWQKRKLDRRLQGLRASAPASRVSATTAFRAYVGAVDVHNRQFATPIAAGPFPADVVQFVNDVLFERIVIEPPRAGAPSGVSGGVQAAVADDEPSVAALAAATPSAAAGNGEGARLEVEFLRRLLERRNRERESELHP